MDRDSIDDSALDDTLRNVRRVRFSDGVVCVHCGFRRVHLHGTFRHRQRYRCARCGRTFSDLTKTPMANSWHPELWELFAQCMADGLTIRATAARLGVGTRTIFRWRHRLLAGIEASDGTQLRGRMEWTSFWLPVNEKGRRDLPRPARRRAPRPRSSYVGEKASVISACDRVGSVFSAVVWKGSVHWPELVRALAARVHRGIIVHGRLGRLSPSARFAREVGGAFETVDGRLGAKPDSNLDTVTAYYWDLKDWLKRFRGVATKYLSHYLAWHRAPDRVAVAGLAPVGT